MRLTCTSTLRSTGPVAGHHAGERPSPRPYEAQVTDRQRRATGRAAHRFRRRTARGHGGSGGHSERVVGPDIGAPVWLCKPKRRSKGVARERDLTGMPQPPVPVVDAESFSLPLLVGRLIDCTVLPNNTLRRVADRWCHHSKGCLQDLGRVVRPLRAAAEITRAIARAAQAEEDRDGCSTSSWVSSSDSDSDTASETSEP